MILLGNIFGDQLRYNGSSENGLIHLTSTEGTQRYTEEEIFPSELICVHKMPLLDTNDSTARTGNLPQIATDKELIFTDVYQVSSVISALSVFYPFSYLCKSVPKKAFCSRVTNGHEFARIEAVYPVTSAMKGVCMTIQTLIRFRRNSGAIPIPIMTCCGPMRPSIFGRSGASTS